MHYINTGKKTKEKQEEHLCLYNCNIEKESNENIEKRDNEFCRLE